MATLRVSIEATGPTTALLTASFTGGQEAYDYPRALAISGIYSYTFYEESAETSGGSNTWEVELSDLDPDTTYRWTVELCSWTSSGWSVVSGYSKTGSFTTEGGGSDEPTAYINNVPYTPYIYTGSWGIYAPYWYTGSWNSG